MHSVFGSKVHEQVTKQCSKCHHRNTCEIKRHEGAELTDGRSGREWSSSASCHGDSSSGLSDMNENY